MELLKNLFENAYPFSLVILTLTYVVQLWLIHYRKKSCLTSIFLILIFVFYILSFFANYNFELFLFFWALRDFVIFTLIRKLVRVFLKLNLKLKLVIFSFIIFFLGLFLKHSNYFKNLGKNISFKSNPSSELLVDIKNINDLSKIKILLKDFNPQIYKSFPQLLDTSITHLDDYYSIDVNDSTDIAEIKMILNNSGLIDWVEDNEIIKLSPTEQNAVKDSYSSNYNLNYTNDRYLNNLWALSLFNYEKYLTYLRQVKISKKAKIFILDTGIDANHEDIVKNYFSLNEKYNTDTDIHGTHCAGIAGAVSNNQVGIASLNSNGFFYTITSITVLPYGRGKQENIIDGIILAADNGADVISMSLGGKSTDARQEAYNKAIEYANNKGAIVVVAAGNENENAINSVPASCKGVITVSAVDRNLNKADFSNFVADIKFKVSAPGVAIYSTIPFDKYEFLNGTSMAAPYVAGLLGIMKSIEPDLTTEQAYRILNSTGKATHNTIETGKFIQPFEVVKAINESNSNSFFIYLKNKILTFKNRNNSNTIIDVLSKNITKSAI